MSPTDYLSGEVSKMLGIPGSSLRRYVIHFGDYLSPDARLKRGRRFTEMDVAVISKIRDLTTQGFNFDQIPAQLDNVVEVNPDPEELPPGSALAIVKGIANVQSTQGAEIADLRGRLEAIEQLEKERQARPWWKKLLG